MTLLLLNEDELRQVVTISESIDAVKTSLQAQAEGRITTPGDFSLPLPDVKGKVRAKGSYLTDAPYYVIKISSTFQDNTRLNLSPRNELLTVFDAATGSPAAVMIDNGYLTTLRAGAVGALTATYLAPDHIDRVAVIGSGSLAYSQIKALRAVRSFESVSVWGRTPLHVDSYARLIVEDYDLDVEIAPSIKAAVGAADLIVTASTSQYPLIQAEWLKPGTHIIALGSQHTNRQTLHSAVLQRADLIIVDDFEQCAATGEIHHALANGAITAADVQGSLSDLVAGHIAGRTHPDQITIADLTKLDAHESAVATLALEKAHFLGLGIRAQSLNTTLAVHPSG